MLSKYVILHIDDGLSSHSFLRLIWQLASGAFIFMLIEINVVEK